jgi:heme-degrading monooxygenase HmoA
MIVTLFRSRLNPGTQDEYGPLATRMSELVRDIPGYISHKGFVADDGERVTIVEFETEEALHEWRVDPERGTAKGHAIESLFAEYKFQICSVIRDQSWVGRTRDTTTTYNAREDGSMRS